MATTVTSQIQGITINESVKAPVAAVSTSNLTLSGYQTVGGVTITASSDNKRTLVRAQNNPVENGIYNQDSSGWQRAKDFNGNRDVVRGTLVLTNNASDVAYRVTTEDPVIGTDAISFEAVTLVMTREGIGLVFHPRTDEEESATVTPTNYYYAPGDVRRYGVGTGVSGSTNTTNLEAALSIGIPIFGGEGEEYPITGTINRTGNATIRNLKLRPTSALKAMQIDGTRKASTTLAADVRIGRDVITVTSAANIAIGDILEIESNAAWPYDQGAEGLLKGETTRVIGISGTSITLAMSTQCEYDIPAETVTITPITPAEVDIDGLDIGWDTPAAAAALGLDGCTGRVSGTFFGAQSVGIGPGSCFGLEIHDSRVLDCYLSGLGYGIQFNACSMCSVHDSFLYNNRRGVDVSGGFPSHHILVNGCNVIGNKNEGSCLGGHGTSNNCAFTNNIVSNSIIGIQLRGPNNLVDGNKYWDCTSFCTMNLAPGLVIRNNTKLKQPIPSTIGLPDATHAYFLEIAGDTTTLNSIDSAQVVVEGNTCSVGTDFIFFGTGTTSLKNFRIRFNNVILENNSAGAAVRFIECSTAATFDSTCEMTGNFVRNVSGSFTTPFTNVTWNGVQRDNTFLSGTTPVDFTPGMADFTATLTGVTAATTGTARYWRNGNQVTLKVPQLLGTSNTTSCTITGLPSAIQPANTQQYFIVSVQDNSTDAAGMVSVASGTVTLYRAPNAAASAFTNSGGKGTAGFEIVYRVD